MAASVSSTVLATTVSSASSFKARNYSSFKSQIPFCFNHLSFSCASNRLVPRKLFRVQATVLQDDEEKVVVEESFQPKTISVDDGKGIHGESSTSSSSSGLERWVIKLEQSINIFLTVSFSFGLFIYQIISLPSGGRRNLVKRGPNSIHLKIDCTFILLHFYQSFIHILY
ncbi:hypothetical protein CsSME_00031115 [Camellia sinensis var. sinensis]